MLPLILISLRRPYAGCTQMLHKLRGSHVLLLCAVLWTGTPAQAAPIALNSVTTLWSAIGLSSGNALDYLNDQQTGQGESDIVGGTANAFYSYFDNNGGASNTDGTMYFRVRLGADENPAGFRNIFFVGIDADRNGSLDIFVGVIANTGGTAEIRIYDAGSNTNTSPSTTSIAAPPSQKVYAVTSSNLNWSAVNTTLDPGVTNTDLNNDGRTDHFLSFTVPFADVVSEALRLSGITVNDSTLMRFVIATSTQDNSLNQDLGGVNGGTRLASTWGQLGAFTQSTSALGGPAADIPEPATNALLGVGLLALATLGRRRRR